MSPAAALLLAALPLPSRAQAPPALMGVSTMTSAAGGAVVTWTTDRPADAEVDYGLTPAYGTAASTTAPPGTAHAVTLGALSPGALHHFRVKSRGPEGALAVSGDFTFAAAAAVPAQASASTGPASGPLVLIMNPQSAAVVSGSVTVSANATAGARVASVQFLLDGLELGGPLTSGPYVFSWNSLFAAEGPHMLAAVARDAAGRAGTSGIVGVIVDNQPPVIKDAAAGLVTGSGAVIEWTTNERADSQVEYGPTYAYGLFSPRNASLVVSRAVPLKDLSPGTQYHYRVRSADAAGNASVSGDDTFTTAPSSAPAAALGAPAEAPPPARAPQKILTPARADGINDKAVFGPEAREVSIVDLRGRRVFHETSSGTPIVWACRDGSGGLVPSGVYIARITTRDSREVYQSFAVAK